MSGEPTTGHTCAFRPGTDNSFNDGRIISATFERNAKPVIDGLSPFLAGLTGSALEIGSGTGQHVVAFAEAFPNLSWTPSDPDAVHRSSIEAWRSHASAPTNPVLEIDAASDWATSEGVKSLSPLGLVLSLNVIHIAPFAVAQGIIRGAGKCLAPGGYLAFYGPFSESGQHTGSGNQKFDQRLRADNPEWGVRDTDELEALGQTSNLGLETLLPMPANNRLLILRACGR